jgi:hypothetical protein
MSKTIHDIAEADRPREKLLRKGAKSSPTHCAIVRQQSSSPTITPAAVSIHRKAMWTSRHNSRRQG